MFNQNFLSHLNLREILDKESFILMDSSFLGQRRNFAQAIYSKKGYKQLEECFLQKQIEKLEKDLEILKEPKIKVLEETVKELEEFQRIVNEKARSFNRNLYILDKKKIKYSEEAIYNKKLFEKICLLSLEKLKKVKDKVYRPNSVYYEPFYEIVKLITEKENLKRPKKIPEWYKIKEYRREGLDWHTDEKIVAALFASLFSEPLSAITKDYHLRLIFKEVGELLLCPDLAPYNLSLSFLMKNKKAKLYYYNVKKDEYYKNSFIYIEKLAPGWHMSSTDEIDGREKFKLACPYSLDNSESVKENEKKLIELKTKHAIIENLIKIDEFC